VQPKISASSAVGSQILIVHDIPSLAKIGQTNELSLTIQPVSGLAFSSVGMHTTDLQTKVSSPHWSLCQL